MIRVPKEKSDEYKIAIEKLISKRVREDQERNEERVITLTEGLGISNERKKQKRNINKLV